MLTTLLTILAGLVAAVALLGAAFVTGMRAKAPIVRRLVARATGSSLNAKQLQSAGSRGASTSIIRHRGRRTGRTIETPVGVVPDGDDFLVALPYGRATQWLRNVLAAGEATLVTDGRTYRVDRPVLVATRSVADRFSRGDRISFRLMAVDDCLRLHRAAEDVAASEHPRAA